MTASITMFQSANKYNAATQTVYADLTNELSTANGYTSGGATLGSVTWAQSTVTMTWDAADTSWAASGGSITARYAVIRSTVTANGHVEPLVAYILLDISPADVTATTGNTFLLQWNASGIFTSAIT